VIGGRGGRLDNEDILAADVLLDFDEGLAIGKGRDAAFAQFDADGFADGAGKGFVGGAAKNFHEYKKYGCSESKYKNRRNRRLKCKTQFSGETPRRKRNLSPERSSGPNDRTGRIGMAPTLTDPVAVGHLAIGKKPNAPQGQGRPAGG
jgi:hypothetical protein